MGTTTGPRRSFAFVLEQTLGHVAHGRNLERALAEEPGVDATVIKINPVRPGEVWARLPGWSNWSLRASWAARAGLKRRLRDGSLDAIFVHTQVPALLAAGLMRATPSVVSLDATPYNFDQQGEAYGHSRGSGASEAFKRRVNQHAFAAARLLVTWCRWAADSLVADYGVPADKIHVIHPGVDLSLFRPGPPRPQGGPVRLLFVGGDFVRKGGDDLLIAARSLGDRVELDIVTGPAEVRPPPGLRCRVHRGLKPQSPELVDLYSSSDVFVLPTRGDCFPQVLAEALAVGMPVVATTVGAIPEVVVDGGNGLLVPPAAPAALAAALETMVSDSELRRRMGAAGMELARRKHDARLNARAIFHLMETVSGRF